MWDGERQLHLGGLRQRSVLAILALHAGTVVSSDRLVDALWGERPPADAATALQQHVSRLRKLLEPHEVVVTRPPGYTLEVPPDRIDLKRYEKLRAEGLRALDAGKPDAAAETLHAALDLWRGRALADLENETFSAEIARELDEGRLDTLESRIEADLALGRHAALVTELRELVRQHPLRERLRGQLMLALYRSGRQSEALEAYADARRKLVEEVGLDPGPELQRLQQAILAHDPGLTSPSSRPRRRTAGRRFLVAGSAAALALLAALATAVVIGRDGNGARVAAVAPGEGVIVALDASTGAIRRRIPAGRTPSAIAARDGIVWIVDADARTVLRVSETSRAVETFSTGATPTDVAVGADAVWVAHGRPLEDAQFVGPVATALARLDPTTGTERADVSLPRRAGALSNLVENHVAMTTDAVWVVTPDFAIARIEAETGAVTAVSRSVRAAAVAAVGDRVWALGVDGEAALLDPRTGKVVTKVNLPVSSVGGLAVGAGAAWVTSPSDGTLWRVGGRSPALGAIDLDRGVSDVAVGVGGVWIANPLSGTLTQLDPSSASVERTIELGGIPRSIALDGETLWIALVADPIASGGEVAGVRPFPASTCERLIAGEGQSDVLIVSDLPLQGGVRVSTTQMVQAIAFVLRERRFRAGRFRVAYQSCDDSVGRTGLFDEAKCAANARAYAANADVVGVVGTFNSPCAVAALPELNRARGGPLAMVSPTNSFVGLTRAAPGVEPALPAALYPTGRRNYVRVYPTDDLQGAALALFARDRGHRRVYVLDDGEAGYGRLLAIGFETAARRLGLTVSGGATWDPRAGSYAALAQRVRRSGATAVFVGGLLDTNAGLVVRDLRATLGRRVDLLAPDGLTPLPLLVDRAGTRAFGTFVSLGGLVRERLPPAGARFVERFRRAQPGVEIELSAVYAAQAAEVLLDAIARSDGSRASVLRELFRLRVEDGLLGSFGFDRNGDVSESPVTILRVVRRGQSNTVASIEGGVVERVVRPSPSLVASSE